MAGAAAGGATASTAGTASADGVAGAPDGPGSGRPNDTRAAICTDHGGRAASGDAGAAGSEAAASATGSTTGATASADGIADASERAGAGRPNDARAAICEDHGGREPDPAAAGGVSASGCDVFAGWSAWYTGFIVLLGNEVRSTRTVPDFSVSRGTMPS
ncbi:MAG: hypothetical protein A3K19_32750 [Lentisphaerae bacterium RIFOXYB12_FULL_65_16]|nr:MAG: hypothetical protein A3K18_20535 [Lentisphaerae bacterium RIFOXYA12_64_32]OGV84513.1 MAG: hypothetical protein A3K19_32750 [Lentisphaerae bacterium RIFOXYB12_FULL_65_16]